MLNRLIENFEPVFLHEQDRSAVEICLAEEGVALMNPKHLVSQVIDPGEFDWDFASLDEGFMRLVGPFMTEPSWTSVLFLQSLREFGRDPGPYLKAIIFLEYAYYSSLINDFYNFHEVFTAAEPDRRIAARLTQLRYAGQYLSKYPAYLLINNTFGIDEDIQSAIHQWLANVYVALGIGRGTMMKWTHRLYDGVTLEAYRQNSINGLCLYLLFPVVLAAIFAGVREETRQDLKKALNHLTLCMKLRMEKRLYDGQVDLDVSRELSGSWIPIVTEGTAFLTQELCLDPAELAGSRFPDVRAVNMAISQAVRQQRDAAASSRIEQMAREHFDRFREIVSGLGLLADMSRRFERCFFPVEET